MSDCFPSRDHARGERGQKESRLERGHDAPSRSTCGFREPYGFRQQHPHAAAAKVGGPATSCKPDCFPVYVGNQPVLLPVPLESERIDILSSC
jgi:hypothetical protein